MSDFGFIMLGCFAFLAVAVIFGGDSRQMNDCVSAGYEWKSGDCVKAGAKE